MADPKTPAQLASDAAEAIRQLNHASMDPRNWTSPTEISDTVNALAALLERLPQALRQLESGLLELSDDHRIRLDNVPDPSEQDIVHQVFLVQSALEETRGHLGQAREALRRATSPLSHMGAPWPEDDDQD